MISTGSRFSSFPIAEQAIVDRLRELHRGDLEFYSEYLDIVRFPSDSYRRLFRDYLRDKYAHDHPDLIFLIFVGNLGTAGELLVELFPRAPVVVVGLTEEELSGRLLSGRVTGIVQRSDPVGTLDLILRLQPDIRRIVLIGGTAEVDRQVMSRAQAAARGYAGRAEFEVWVQRSMPEILTAASSLPPQTAILFTRMFRDGAGRAVNSAQAAQSIAKASNGPVYVMTDTMLGTGAIGGSTVDLVSLGRRAGEQSQRILNGAEPKSLPLEIITQGVPVFDWRALRRWGINESILPKDSVIRFRPRSMWEQYRWYMVGTAVLFLLQAGLITGLIVNRLRRDRAEKALQESQDLIETATEAGGLGLWARGLKDGNVWANAPLRSLFGFGQNEVLRTDNLLARVHPDDSAQVASVVQHAREANIPFEGEFRVLLPEGRERWVLAKGRTMDQPNERGGRRMGVVMDITERKRAEERLRESEDNFRRLVETTAAVIWQADGDSWMFTYVGPHAVKLLGYPVEQWYTKDFWISHIHPGDRERAIEICQTRSRNVEEFDFEYRMIHRSGEVVWVHDIVSCQRLEGKPLQLRGLLFDVTERKKMEEGLRESEERFRMMANTAPVMIWMAGPDKLCTFFNKGWLDFTGRALEDELGDGWARGVHREDYARCLENYSESFEVRREFTMEYRLRRADGEYRWVLDHGVARFAADGAFLGYIGTAIDIGEGKRSEEMLKRERAFLRQVIDINPNFIFAKNRDGRFTLVNQAVADAYGTTVEGLIGKTDADFNSNRDEVEHFHRMDLEVIDNLQERFISEEHLTDAQGKMRWLQTVKRPIVEKDGVANQVLGASTDITARKEAEAELQRNRDELAHLTRVSTLGELAASLAHELNQPLGAILSNAEAGEMLLMAEPPALDEVREILADIRNDDRRASDVIRGLRNLLRKQEMEREPLQVNDGVAEVLKLLSIDAAHRNATLKFEPAANLPLVEGDRVKLQQVVLNLVLNALDATTELVDGRKQVVIRSRSGDDGMITVSVSDCGPGVPPDRLPKLFEPFFTTKKEGMGMGLSIARTIVEAHHGRIWAENNPDVGSTFYFTIPLSAEGRGTRVG